LEEEIRYNITYNVEGIHESVMATKSLLYAVNAVRLTIKDIQMVMERPTFSNVMWTAIQITRMYTHIRRLIRYARAEQKSLMGETVAAQAMIQSLTFKKVGIPRIVGIQGGAALMTPVARARLAQTTFLPGGGLGVATARGMFPAISGFAMANPYLAGAAIGIGAAAIVGGALYWQREQARKAWIEQQREIARSQGLEP